MTNKKQLGSVLFCEALLREKVRLLFGIPGGVVLPLYDYLNEKGYAPRLQHILPRQEQGGGFAADGMARATGEVGVAMGTSGPGATNLLTSLVHSMMDSVPVVYITGQVFDRLIGTDAFQEADVLGMALPSAKHSFYVNHASQLQQTVKEAFFIARSGRPGPVHIDVTKDAWITEADDNPSVKINLPGYEKTLAIHASDGDLQKIDQVLAQKNIRPIIIAGHGVEIAGAQKELLAFAEKHNIPVVNTILGFGSFPQGHKLWMGMLGMHGEAAANYAVHNANVIIGMGVRFDDRITGKLASFIEGKTFIHFEIDESEIGKNVPTAVPIAGDLRQNLARANQLLSPHTYPDWWNQMNAWKQQYNFLALPQYSGTFLSQPHIVDLISQLTNGKAIVASDVGRNQMWVSRFYRFKYPRSYLSSGGLGSMGYSVPAAMGAKLACPDREVWSISGDGGFMMNVQELATIAEHKINIKMCIMEDRALGMVRQWQSLLHKGNISHSVLKNPDFVQLAKAFDIPAWRVHTMEEAQKALIAARAINGPTLITFMVDPNQNIFPMVAPNTSLGQQALSEKDLVL